MYYKSAFPQELEIPEFVLRINYSFTYQSWGGGVQLGVDINSVKLKYR